jgi:hypothetical protein
MINVNKLELLAEKKTTSKSIKIAIEKKILLLQDKMVKK